jgi:hypothetical protein
MSIRQDLYNYRKNKRRIKALCDQITVLETKASKVTATYSQDSGTHNMTGEDRILENICKIVEIEKRIKVTLNRIKRADAFLARLKPYQRHIIVQCIVNHIPYQEVAKREKTSVKNIAKIIENAL